MKPAAVILVCALFGGATAHAELDSRYRVLHSFKVVGNGGQPGPALILGSDGRLYGVTNGGDGRPYYGTVFAMRPDGTGFTVVHGFDRTESGNIWGGLVRQGRALYGVAGTTIFRVDEDGRNFSWVHSIPGTTYANMVLAGGMLYGVTDHGGSFDAGTLFRVRPDGSDYAVLRSFDPLADGREPWAPLLPYGGYLYGTTSHGLAFDAGGIFRVRLDGTGFKVLHTFDEGDGRGGLGPMVAGPNGVLYGPAFGGPDSSGVVFKINPDGSGYKVLHTFLYTTRARGTIPISISIRSNVLYALLQFGGRFGYGALLQMGLDGRVQAKLYDFDGPSGRQPVGGILSDSQGSLYGMTSTGGAHSAGVVFRFAACPRCVY